MQCRIELPFNEYLEYEHYPNGNLVVEFYSKLRILKDTLFLSEEAGKLLLPLLEAYKSTYHKAEVANSIIFNGKLWIVTIGNNKFHYAEKDLSSAISHFKSELNSNKVIEVNSFLDKLKPEDYQNVDMESLKKVFGK